MNNIVLCKKDIMEFIRTKKAFAVLCIFIFVGISAPISIYIEPKLVKMMVSEYGSGILKKFQQRTFGSCYTELFNNLNQIGIITIMLFTVGEVCEERKSGTISLILTKNISRTAFITSKFISRLIIFGLSYLISMFSCIIYSEILFSKYYVNGMWYGLCISFLYAMNILALSIFVSILMKNVTMSLVVAFIIYIMLKIINSIPIIEKFTPSAAFNYINKLLLNVRDTSNISYSILILILSTIVYMTASIYIFKGREI